jgi:hypothetical protein
MENSQTSDYAKSDYAKYVYELELLNSPLFHITSKKRLAILLCSSIKELNHIVRSKNQMYQYFNENKTDDSGNIIKVRPIQNPHDRLKLIHSRIGKFLGNLKAPDYLHSKRSKSAISNAKAHAGIKGHTLNIDITDFYPSTSKAKVQAFFGYTLQYPTDIAKYISEICTVNNCLPTGSPLSSALAFWANKSMFDEIYKVAKSRSITMTVYVDDISFTGKAVNQNFLNKIIQIIGKYQHKIKQEKIKFFPENSIKFVTGVAIVNGSLQPAHRHFRDIRLLQKIDNNIQATLRLIGKNNYIKQIINHV